MKLNEISIKDKALFAEYLGLRQHGLSVYTFENIFIWKDIFQIYWTLIKESLCVFFKDRLGCFLYIPPQAPTIKPEIIEETFKVMDNFNENKTISRIENVEEKDLSFYQNLGYDYCKKYPEYLYQRCDLAQLKGARFKSKRACLNYFLKNYKFSYLPFSLKFKANCLKLYNCWMRKRKMKIQDPLYQGMLLDNQICLKILLNNYQDLNVIGKVVKIDSQIKAFTFGFKLSSHTFCILYEVTDLSVKGLAQFIFCEFCSELTDYKYINIMDDSGLENLKRVKLSYKPIRLIPTYIVKR